MTQRYDVIVVGVGAMGSAACYHLAKRGVRVLGLDRFDIPNARGSSHGFSRVIRKAYFEHPDYVPLLQRAYANWDELEATSKQKLLYRTGGIYMGRPESEAIAGSLRAMRHHKLQHEEFTHAQLAEHYPQFVLPSDYVGLFEEATGFLLPERCIAAHAEAALRAGAELHGHEAVVDWSSNDSGATVRTEHATYHCDSLLFCGGAWASDLVRDVGVNIRVTRQVFLWVWPKDPRPFELGRLPVWLIDTGNDAGQHYGVPMMPDNPGLKIALHKPGHVTDPDNVLRDPQPGDEATVRPILHNMIPLADGPVLAIRTCLYENSPDGHFIIDRHPKRDRVWLACGFSGHGFKFASVVGEVMADLTTRGKTDLPVRFLGLSRFRQ